MKIFKLKFLVHFGNLIAIFFCLALCFEVKNIILIFVLISSVIFSLLNLINNLSLKHIVNENGLMAKSLFATVSFRWEDIECVILKPTNIIFKPMVVVCGKGKVIGIWPWIRNYRQLLKYVVEECKAYNQAQIDSDVDDLLIVNK